MSLVRFGRTWINFAAVTCIRDLVVDRPGGGTSTGVVRVEFGPGHHVDLVEHYAEVIAWLDQNVTNPPGPVP